MQKTWEKWNGNLPQTITSNVKWVKPHIHYNVCLEAGFAENDFVNAMKKILWTRTQPRSVKDQDLSSKDQDEDFKFVLKDKDQDKDNSAKNRQANPLIARSPL